MSWQVIRKKLTGKEPKGGQLFIFIAANAESYLRRKMGKPICKLAVNKSKVKTRKQTLIIPLLIISVGLAGIIFSNYILEFLFNSEQEISQMFHSAIVYKIAGNVRHQNKGKTFWHDLSSQRQEVRGGDTIYTGKDGRAELSYNDGASLEVAPDSLVVIKEERALPQAGALNALKGLLFRPEVKNTIVLKKGSVKVLLAPKTAAIDIQTPTKTVHLESAGRPIYSSIGSDGEAISREIASEENESFIPLAPHANQELSFKSEKGARNNVSFLWKPPGARGNSESIFIEIDGDEMIATETGADVGQLELPLSGGTFRWRIRCGEKNAKCHPSEWVPFSIKLEEPPAPEPIPEPVPEPVPEPANTEIPNVTEEKQPNVIMEEILADEIVPQTSAPPVVDSPIELVDPTDPEKNQEPVSRPPSTTRLSALPALYFSRIDGSYTSTGEKEVALSYLNYGLSLKIDHNLTKNFIGSVSVGMRHESYNSDISTSTITNPALTSTDFSVGAGWQVWERAALNAKASLNQETYFKRSAAAPDVDLQQIRAPEFSLGVNVHLIQRPAFRVDLDANSSYRLAATAGPTKTDAGLGLEGKISAKMDFGGLTLSAGPFYRTLQINSSDYKSSRKDIGLQLGLTWHLPAR